MTRKVIKVEIPVNRPDDLIKLAKDVKQKHDELGTGSPLGGIDMSMYGEKLDTGSQKRVEAKKLHDQAEALNQEANLNLGIDKAQTSQTRGTVYSLLTSARDILLAVYKGNEEKLSEWGFNVVTGTASRSK